MPVGSNKRLQSDLFLADQVLISGVPLGPVHKNQPTEQLTMLLNEMLFRFPTLVDTLFKFRVPCPPEVKELDKDHLVLGSCNGNTSISLLSMINTVLSICGQSKIAVYGIPTEDRSGLYFIQNFTPVADLEESTTLLQDGPSAS